MLEDKNFGKKRQNMQHFCLSLHREVYTDTKLIYTNKKHTYILRDTIHGVTTGLKQKIVDLHIWDQLLNPRFLKQNIIHIPKRLHTLNTNNNSDYRICHATNCCCNIPSCNMSRNCLPAENGLKINKLKKNTATSK